MVAYTHSIQEGHMMLHATETFVAVWQHYARLMLYTSLEDGTFLARSIHISPLLALFFDLLVLFRAF